MAEKRSIIKLSDSSNVTINMEGATIHGNLHNTNVLDISRSRDVNVSAKGMTVVDTSQGGYVPPAHRRRRPSTSSSSSSSSSDDELYWNSRHPGPSREYGHGEVIDRVVVNMEVSDSRSLATRFEVTKTIGFIKEYIRQRSDAHKHRDFVLVNKKNSSVEYRDESLTLQQLRFKEHTMLVTRFIR